MNVRMAKTFRTVGSGSAQTTEPIENNKIPIYDTKADAEADLANLTAGQIIATKDEGNETSTPVDVVEDGNMHAVTSNAVADYVDTKIGTIAHSEGALYNFENYYKAAQRTPYSGLIVFMRIFTTGSNSTYILNLCENMTSHLIGGDDNATFTFDMNTYSLGIQIKSGYGTLTSQWATILG